MRVYIRALYISRNALHINTNVYSPLCDNILCTYVSMMHSLTSRVLLLFVYHSCINMYMSICVHECMRILLNATVDCIYEQRNAAARRIRVHSVYV